ncbi:MAG: hypothetical protein MZW92_47795 [Comamonadaceae bacterium]|nr:hypothetical protein [Comamonadaceae bacterium]
MEFDGLSSTSLAQHARPRRHLRGTPPPPCHRKSTCNTPSPRRWSTRALRAKGSAGDAHGVRPHPRLCRRLPLREMGVMLVSDLHRARRRRDLRCAASSASGPIRSPT